MALERDIHRAPFRDPRFERRSDLGAPHLGYPRPQATQVLHPYIGMRLLAIPKSIRPQLGLVDDRVQDQLAHRY